MGENMKKLLFMNIKKILVVVFKCGLIILKDMFIFVVIFDGKVIDFGCS